MLENIVFSPTEREKDHLIINILSGRRVELASCSNFFVRDCCLFVYGYWISALGFFFIPLKIKIKTFRQMFWLLHLTTCWISMHPVCYYALLVGFCASLFVVKVCFVSIQWVIVLALASWMQKRWLIWQSTGPLFLRKLSAGYHFMV